MPEAARARMLARPPRAIAMTEQTVIPQLRMLSAERSLPYYVGQLGFSIDWEHRFEPGYPLFVQLTRAGQTIFLSEHSGDCEPGGAVYFLVPDVDQLYLAISARGAVPGRGHAPRDTPWGTREMLLYDPDGNRLRFASERDDA